MIQENNVMNLDEKIPDVPLKTCKWKLVDNGMYGCPDYEWQTGCGENYDADKVIKKNYCPNCGGKII